MAIAYGDDALYYYMVCPFTGASLRSLGQVTRLYFDSFSLSAPLSASHLPTDSVTPFNLGTYRTTGSTPGSLGSATIPGWKYDENDWRSPSQTQLDAHHMALMWTDIEDRAFVILRVATTHVLTRYARAYTTALNHEWLR